MSHIDDVIAKCSKALEHEDKDAAEELLDAIPFAYQLEIPKIFDGLTYYDAYRTTYIFEDLARLEATLKAYREKREHDIRIAELQAGAITVQASSTSTAESNVSIRITLEQVMEQIDGIDDSALNESEKTELLIKSRTGDRNAREQLVNGNLRLVLSVIQRFSNRKGKDRLLEATKEIIGWVCDKGIESLPTVLNYVMQAAQTIM